MDLAAYFVLLCPQNLPECANGRFSANRPSGEETGEVIRVICLSAKVKYFSRDDWTRQISLNPFRKIVWPRNAESGVQRLVGRN